MNRNSLLLTTAQTRSSYAVLMASSWPGRKESKPNQRLSASASVSGLASEGGAVLFYSSETPELVNLCHRVIVLYGAIHTDFALSSLILAVPAFGAGLLVYQLIIRQVAKAKLASAPEHAQLLATLGLIVTHGVRQVRANHALVVSQRRKR